MEPLADYVIGDYIHPGEEISSSELAWRLAGTQPSKPGERPAGKWQRLARVLRVHWEGADLVDVYKGPRGAIMLRLRQGDVKP